MSQLGIVVIGRNEAPRIRACLNALSAQINHTVYVDSGSIDGSADVAESLGFATVRLTSGPYTAARGRRVGLEFLQKSFAEIHFVQYVDGDCEISSNWIDTALRFMEKNPTAAAVVGRLREKHPDRSLFVRLTDVEWQLPEGCIDVIGGISMMRVNALHSVGGWRDGLIAGEELDLSVRLTTANWSLHRLGESMCTHDIGIAHFSEFWRRSIRSGYAYFHLSRLHRYTAPRRWRRKVLSSIVYGVVLPFGALTAFTPLWPLSIVCGILYLMSPIRILAGRLRSGDSIYIATAYSIVTTLCKSAMALGTIRCFTDWAFGRIPKIIEFRKTSLPAGHNQSH